MELELRFFASFRSAVGQKTIFREFDDDATVGDVLEILDEEYPEMELFEEDGSLREFNSIMRNGKDITHIDGLATTLEDGDKISAFPPAAGG